MIYFNENRFVGYFLACLTGVILMMPANSISRDTAKSKLQQARDNLRISQATEKRIASELQRLKRSGNTSADVIKEYEIYLERVQAMVAENQKIVNAMKAAHARYSNDKRQSTSAPEDEIHESVNPRIPEERSVDELAALDRELNKSLWEFDEMLLQELDLIRAKSAKKMRDLAEEAAEAAKRLKAKGIDLDPSASSEASDESGQTQSAEKEGSGGPEDGSGAEKPTEVEKPEDTEKGEGTPEAASRKTSPEAGQGSTGERKRYSGGEDDDIVARQLREAAENESDPELKEKLWKEYEAYKKNTSK